MEQLLQLDMAQVFPNPGQPRKEFDEFKLEELSQSIQEYGVMEPIVVTPRNGRFMIVAGERRYRASVLAGKPEIPAMVIEANDNLVEEMALLENIQREDLNPIDEARAYKSLIDRGMSRDELADKMGIIQSWRIDEKISILSLIPACQDAVKTGLIQTKQAYRMRELTPENQAVVEFTVRSGKIGPGRKFNAFVRGLLLSQRQQTLFELKPMTSKQANAMEVATRSINLIGRHVGQAQDALNELNGHKIIGINSQSIDLIIAGLMKIRKRVATSEGLTQAAKEKEV